MESGFVVCGTLAVGMLSAAADTDLRGITTIYVPAFLMLGYWFVIQVLGGLPALGGHGGGVAFWAHVGGFAAGFLLINVFKDRALVEEHRRLLTRYGR